MPSHSCIHVSKCCAHMFGLRLPSSWLKMARAKNTASPQEISTILLGFFKGGLRESSFLHVDVEDVVEDVADMMVLVLNSTPRPTSGLLMKAFQHAFNIESTLAKTLGDRLAGGFQHCALKKKSTTSGKKLRSGVKKVVAAMVALGPQETRPSPSPTPSRETLLPFVELDQLPEEMVPSKFPSSRDDILKLYGVRSSSSSLPKKAAEQSLVEVLSSSQESCMEEAPAASCASSSSKAVQFFDSKSRCLVRIENGITIRAIMTAGPQGFAIAQFPGESAKHKTEMPNIVLTLKEQAPGPPKPAVCKRPAGKIKAKAKKVKAGEIKAKAKMDEDEEAEVEEVEEAEVEEVEEAEVEEVEEVSAVAPPPPPVLRAPGVNSNNYVKMFYKAPRNAWAVRQAFLPKKQLFQITSRTKTRSELEVVADEAITMLRSGRPEAMVIQWAKSQV